MPENQPSDEYKHGFGAGMYYAAKLIFEEMVDFDEFLELYKQMLEPDAEWYEPTDAELEGRA